MSLWSQHPVIIRRIELQSSAVRSELCATLSPAEENVLQEFWAAGCWTNALNRLILFIFLLLEEVAHFMFLILKDRWKSYTKTHNPHVHPTLTHTERSESTLGLVCSFSCLFFFLSSSALGVMKEQLNSVNMKESLSKLTDHSSSKLASQASSVLAILGDTS